MPLATDPQKRFRFWLELDRARPEGERAAFLGRFLTSAQRQRLQAFREQGVAEKDDAKSMALLYQALAVGLAGWEHLVDPETGLEIPYDPANLPALERALTDSELWELSYDLVSGARLGETELKKSESPSPGSSDGSAGGPVPRKGGPAAGAPRA